MADIVKIDTQSMSMTSKQIAELTGKQHYSVLRDVRKMLEELDIVNNPDMYYPQYQGVTVVYDDHTKRVKEYKLNKSLTITLTSGYSMKQRHAIVNRWLELEGNQPPTSFSEALQLATNIQKALEDAQEALDNAQLKITTDAPKVELANAISAKGYCTRREWVKTLKNENNNIKEKAVTQWLIDAGYCFRDQLTRDLHAYSKFEHLLTLKRELINGYYRTLLVITDEGVKQLSPPCLYAFK